MRTLSEAEYEKLCLTCDQLLLAPDATLERVAIPWLHVLNEHPSNLLKYSGLFTQSPTGRLLRLRSAASQIRRWIKSGIKHHASPNLPRQGDVLFISHLLNVSQIGADEDFYFGPLPELLMRQGISSCVALIDHTGARHRVAVGWSAEMARRTVLADSLSAMEELDFRKRLQREARCLRIEARRRKDSQERQILKEAARQAMSGSSIATLRMHQQIQYLVDRLSPKAIVVTYEGHAWERLAFAAARRSAPGIRCIGYHHTVLFPRHHAALRLLVNRDYDPDVVLTAGDVSRDRFRKSFENSGIRVATMGIHRRQAHATDAGTESGHGKKVSCLVIPDGITSEVEFLFDFGIESARRAPDINFILRLHPVVSREKVMTRFPRFRQLPANVEISASTLDDDFARSHSALYRGSNAAIYAVIAGVRPFYVTKPAEMTIDSLYDLRSWKRVVSEPDEFLSYLREDWRDGTLPPSSDAAAAAAYCKRYFMPPDYPVFAAAISDGRSTLTHPMSAPLSRQRDSRLVSVVIPTLGGDSLAGTIEALNAGTIVPAEILVCIPHGYATRVPTTMASNVRVVETVERGQVAQRIEGFRAARNAYVLQLDDDVAVEPHCLERLVAAVAASDDNCSVAAALRHVETDKSVYAGYTKRYIQRLYYLLLNGARGYAPGVVTAAGTEIGVDPGYSTSTLHDVEWLPGGCALHSKKNLVLENYYPHTGKAYCEDLYQSKRLSQKGVGMRIAANAIAWIDDPRGERVPFALWLKDLIGDYRARRYYLRESSGSAWRMHAYYGVRVLSHLGKLLLRPAR